MQPFTSLLSIFGLFIALIQTSVLAAPIALSKNIEQVGKRTLVPAGGSDYSPTSASDSELVLQWLTEKGASYADPEKLVFYTSPNDGTGYEMAENFVRANPSYKNFWDLYGEDCESDFGISAEDVPYEAAEAMAQYASQVTRVFGASDAASDSIWKTVELPALKGANKVKSLLSMADNALEVDDTIGTLAIDGVTATVAEGAAADILTDFLVAAILL